MSSAEVKGKIPQPRRIFTAEGAEGRRSPHGPERAAGQPLADRALPGLETRVIPAEAGLRRGDGNPLIPLIFFVIPAKASQKRESSASARTKVPVEGHERRSPIRISRFNYSPESRGRFFTGDGAGLLFWRLV